MMLYLLPSGDHDWAKELSDKTGIPFLPVDKEPEDDSLRLVLSDRGLFLSDGTLSYQGDFHTLLARVEKNRLNSELLVKAAKPKSFSTGATLLDATAGLGEDSFLLAAAGFCVTLCERNPVIFSLLADTMKRAREEALLPILSRMELYFGDSKELLQSADGKYDLVYLDPMFPARAKSGLIKKKFQLLQKLERPEENGEELLSVAI